MTDIEWPEGWDVSREKSSGTRFSVHIEHMDFSIYRSGGNEELWYVIQYWIGSPEEHDTDITGQCATLAEAVDGLRRWLAGEFVPSGDVITVLLEGIVTDEDLPIHHDSAGNKRVYVAIRDDRG